MPGTPSDFLAGAGAHPDDVSTTASSTTKTPFIGRIKLKATNKLYRKQNSADKSQESMDQSASASWEGRDVHESSPVSVTQIDTIHANEAAMLENELPEVEVTAFKGEYELKTPSRAVRLTHKLPKWKKMTSTPSTKAKGPKSTLQQLSLLPSKRNPGMLLSDTMDFDDCESLANSIQYLALLLPDSDDHDEGNSGEKARERFRETVNCTFHLIYPSDSNVADDEAKTIVTGNRNIRLADLSQSLFQINEAHERIQIAQCKTPPRREYPVSLDGEELDFSDVEKNLRKILLTARQHVVAREFDEAAEVYSRLLVNCQARWQSITQGRHKKNEKLRVQYERTLKQWIGTIYHNMAVTNNLHGKHDAAVQNSQEAVKIRKDLIESQGNEDVIKSISPSLHVVNSLIELGLALYSAGDFVPSREAVSEALQIMHRLFPYESTPTVAKILNIIGCIQFESGQLVAALASFEESLDIQRSVLAHRETSAIDELNAASASVVDFTLLNVSTTLCNIGLVHWKRHRLEKALSTLEEALIFQESVLGDSAHCLFIQRTESLIHYLTEVQEQVNLEEINMDKEIWCGANRFGCDKSIDTFYTAKSAVSFVPPTRRRMAKPTSDDGLADYASTISVHYVFHSIHMIVLGAPPCFLTAIDKPNTNSVGGARASQHNLQKSIDHCLQHYARFLNGNENNKLQSSTDSQAAEGDVFGMHSIPFCGQYLDTSKPISPKDLEEQPSDWQPMAVDFHSIHKFTIQCLSRAQYTEAILLYHNILLTATALSRESNESEGYADVAGMALHHLGVIYMHAEAYQDAKTMFLKAIEFRLEVCQRLELTCTSRSLSEEQVTAYYALAISLSSLALACFLLSQYEDALVHFSQALRFLRKVPSSSWIDMHISQVWNNIACTHACIGEAGLRNALTVLDSALAQCPSFLASDCLSKSSQDQETSHIHTTLLINKGIVELHVQDYGQSLISFDEALRYLQSIDTTTLEDTDTIMEYMAYAMACSNCNGDEHGKKMKQLIRSYKDMLINSSS